MKFRDEQIQVSESTTCNLCDVPLFEVGNEVFALNWFGTELLFCPTCFERREDEFRKTVGLIEQLQGISLFRQIVGLSK